MVLFMDLFSCFSGKIHLLNFTLEITQQLKRNEGYNISNSMRLTVIFIRCASKCAYFLV